MTQKDLFQIAFVSRACFVVVVVLACDRSWADLRERAAGVGDSGVQPVAGKRGLVWGGRGGLTRARCCTAGARRRACSCTWRPRWWPWGCAGTPRPSPSARAGPPATPSPRSRCVPRPPLVVLTLLAARLERHVGLLSLVDPVLLHLHLPHDAGLSQGFSLSGAARLVFVCLLKRSLFLDSLVQHFVRSCCRKSNASVVQSPYRRQFARFGQEGRLLSDSFAVRHVHNVCGVAVVLQLVFARSLSHHHDQHVCIQRLVILQGPVFAGRHRRSEEEIEKKTTLKEKGEKKVDGSCDKGEQKNSVVDARQWCQLDCTFGKVVMFLFVHFFFFSVESANLKKTFSHISFLFH